MKIPCAPVVHVRPMIRDVHVNSPMCRLRPYSSVV